MPFKTKNGRADPKKIHAIIIGKKNQHIAGTETENGKIMWSTKLTQDCNHGGEIQQKLTPLLAALMSTNYTFDSFLDEASGFVQPKKKPVRCAKISALQKIKRSRLSKGWLIVSILIFQIHRMMMHAIACFVLLTL